MRRAVLIAAALLGSCAPAARNPPSVLPAGNAAVCRIGPDGGPPAARSADRGIGGTGALPVADRQADRGIGGTGIVGVITGFASVCVAGREVAFDGAVPVRIDGDPGAPADLRAGQLAAVEARGLDTALRARSIAVRHEVSGPVEAVAGDGVLRVAGQQVVVSEQARAVPGGAVRPRPGEWVAVSGLRGPDDTIQATRLDRRVPGTALVRGMLLDKGGTLSIGALEIRSAPRGRALVGRSVTASGRYRDGALYVETLAGDVLTEDPPAYFAGTVQTFVLEGYATAASGRLRLGRGLDAAASPEIGSFAPRRAVVEFKRGQDGSLRATFLRDVGAAPGGLSNPGRKPGLALAPRPGPGENWTLRGDRTNRASAGGLFTFGTGRQSFGPGPQAGPDGGLGNPGGGWGAPGSSGRPGFGRPAR